MAINDQARKLKSGDASSREGRFNLAPASVMPAYDSGPISINKPNLPAEDGGSTTNINSALRENSPYQIEDDQVLKVDKIIN